MAGKAGHWILVLGAGVPLIAGGLRIARPSLALPWKMRAAVAGPEQGALSNRGKGSHLHANRLIHEKSPYLLMHAHNPVDWYPWGEKAFAKAHHEQKVIFLSVGYYTCHWRHVMERESFSDLSIAEIMNREFVSIQVDREERPDVDRIYRKSSRPLRAAVAGPYRCSSRPTWSLFSAAPTF